jgi:hypothetical protein
MSTVRRTSALYNAHLASVAAVQPEHETQFRALTEGLTSAALADLHTEIDLDFSVGTIDDAERLWSKVERSLAWEQAFSDATYNEFSHVESLLESLAESRHEIHPDDLETEFAEFHTDLLHAIDTARSETAGIEQRATAEAIDLALKDLGYFVERADLEGIVTGFEASMANSKLVVEVTAAGEVIIDFVGLSDTESCGSAQEALVEKVATYGVDLAEHDRHDHRDPRGGGLVQRVARASGRTLAERIVSAHTNAPATQNLGGKQARTTQLTKKASA